MSNAQPVQAPAATYADIHNSKFTNTGSHFVDLVTRLNETIAKMPPRAQANWTARLKNAIQQFKRNNPGVKDFANRSKFRLCQAVEKPLGDIVIDTTMQREPDLQWIIKIIENFRAYQASPIQVYQITNNLQISGNDDLPSRAGGEVYGAWDGQHTALALYLICRDALNLDFTTVTVPCNIYAIGNRGELRSNFINVNTTVGKNAGKKPLDIIDIFEQKVYGVAQDGVTDPEWVSAFEKWQHLTRAGLFLTAEKFGNANEIGAISRLNEIDEASEEVIRQFAVYGKYVVDMQQRPINSKEIPIIIEFLNLCEQNQITYTDAEIEDMAQHCIDLFNANFDAGSVYWDYVHQSNINAYNKTNTATGLPTHLWPEAPKNLKNTPQGTAFFWHQLKKSWANGKPYPLQPMSVYIPDTKDLF
jgi:hypothetical protein